LLIHHFTEC